MQTGLDLLLRQPVRFHGTDTRVAYRVVGQGPALLLIHGFPTNGLSFRHVIDRLHHEFTCVVVDVVGAGQSIWNDDTDFSVPAHARRMKDLMEQLGFDRYAVVGHDSGGAIARHLALQAPLHVTRLALINTEIPGHSPPWIPVYQKLLPVPGSADVVRMLFALGIFRRSRMGLGNCFRDPRLIGGEFHELFMRPIASERRNAQGMCRFMAGLDWKENDQFKFRHRDIACPVYLIWGRDDPTFPVALAREMVSQFRHCIGLHEIDGAKLYVHEERPDEVNAAMLPFLRGELDLNGQSKSAARPAEQQARWGARHHRSPS